MNFSLREYKVFEGVQWLKIFHHKMTATGGGFDSFEEASFVNKTNKFSILSIIDAKYKINGKYEFLLKYPSKEGYNRWRQSIFPLYEYDSKDKTCAKGYRGIHIDWNQSRWCGLVRSVYRNDEKCIPSLIDGTIGTIDWFYSIGRINNCSPFNTNSIPGPSELVNEVILYIRNPQFNTCYNNAYKRLSFGFASIILLLTTS